MDQYDVIVIGAGLNGLYQLYRLREAGFRVRLLETGTGVGGTWFWNRYPGARLDSESYTYGYFFSRELLDEWAWSEEFVGQPELERYYNFVADKFHLRDDIDFETRVAAATWNEKSLSWQLRSSDGRNFEAPYVVSATGMLSAFQLPPYEGIDTFTGTWHHTSRWPEGGVDLRGKRVAVLGTGSTGIQVIQSIATDVESLTVFQRTPNWATPINNLAITADRAAELRATAMDIHALTQQTPTGFKHSARPVGTFDVDDAERIAYLEKLWNEPGMTMYVKNFRDIMLNQDANDAVTDFLAGKIRERVADPETAAKLIPDHFYGMKRPPLENGYYEIYNRPNVSLVSLKEEAIVRLTEKGIQTTAREYEFDDIIFATGFDAVTGALSRIDIRGTDEVTLDEWWANGPRTYMAIQTHHFPNFFILGGPQGPGGNNPRTVEGQVDWVTECLVWLRDSGIHRIEATAEAEAEWIEHVNELVSHTLSANSKAWAWGSNTPGKARAYQLYSGAQPALRERMAVSATHGYEGFDVGRPS
jgi:cation diffusion facilitator CzcD-associated flavoprotein CzcO